MILEISSEAEAILEDKARIHKVGLNEILNAMILEFEPSTIADRALQGKTWQTARVDFERDHPNATAWESWRAGYVFGWRAFPDAQAKHLRSAKRGRPTMKILWQIHPMVEIVDYFVKDFQCEEEEAIARTDWFYDPQKQQMVFRLFITEAPDA